MLFVFLYFLSFFIVMNSDDWVLVWIGLEINMMSFILLIFGRESIDNIECCLKYFFIQSLGSALLLNIFYFNMDYFLYLGSLIMSYKMGAGMFYFWFPSICMGIEWGSCLILMFFQKIIPMILISLMMSWVIWIIMLVSLIVGVMGSMNQINIKQLLAYSSVHHVGWMMVCLKLKMNLWVFYLILYFFVMFPLIILMKNEKMYHLMNIYFNNYKYSFIFLVMSMAGMPPFLGFFLKWMVFYYTFTQSVVMLIFMILMAVVMFYIYVRIIYSVLMSFVKLISWKKKDRMKFITQLNMISFLGIILGLVFILFMLY